MSVPESRERLFRYIEERGEVTFDALNQLITKENLDFGPGVYALDVLLGSDDWWRVSVDVDKKIVTAARAPLAAAR